MITNAKYIEFMEKMVVDQSGKNPLTLTEWEQKFLAGFNAAYRAWQWMTPGRAASVDKMWMRYGADLNWPHPLDRVVESGRMKPADPDGCEYIVREDGQQRRCNDPATCREPGRLRYCEAHGRAVQEDCKRAGLKIALINFP